MNSFGFIALVVFTASTFHAGSALHCFVCNSGSDYEGAMCADPFDEEAATNAGLLMDCSTLEEDKGITPAKNYTLCRKYLQDVNGDFRIVRTCATDGREGKCIDRTGTAKIKLQYCECANSEPSRPCNDAPFITFGFVTLALALLATLLPSLS
jgi:hypothetical protein